MKITGKHQPHQPTPTFYQIFYQRAYFVFLPLKPALECFFANVSKSWCRLV